MVETELRARDLERASRSDPSLLDPNELLWLMKDRVWSVRMHVARMLPRVAWSSGDYEAVLDFLFEQASDDNTFVRAWAVDSLAVLAVDDDAIRPRVLALLDLALAGKPALRVRAREGLRRLGGVR